MPAREYRWRHLALLISLLSYVLGSGRVTSDKIFAAICVYMLLGYGWTFVYSSRTHRRHEPWQFWKRSWGNFISWP
jgi:hypothetical protein